MKFYVKDSNVSVGKRGKDARIVGISDLHYTKSLGLYFLSELTFKIQSLSPTHICFLGDLVDDDSKEVIAWLNDLSKIAPVYFALGNHDITRYIPVKDMVEETHLTNEMLNEIKNINNLEVLENGRTVHNNGNAFMGLPYYDISETEEMINNANQYDVDLKSGEYNIMLSHNPWIMNPEVFKRLKEDYYNTDLILSGHTHNGLVPHMIDNVLPGNRGFYAPSQGILPKTTRGVYEVAGDGIAYDGFILPALRTLPEMGGAGNAINKIVYPPALQLIRVEKKK